MKKVGKFLANVLIVAYAVIAIVVTILLLSYNDYHHSVIGGYTFILLTDDELEEHGFEEGSLVLVKETKAKNINEGDYVFLYRYITTSQFEIKYAQVLAKDDSNEYAVQYILEGNIIVDHDDLIGSTKDIKVIPHLGTILSILESRYGYLFLIVVVSFIAFLYEIYELIMEIKYGEREEEEYEDDEEEEEEEYDYEDEDEDEYEEEEEEVVVKPKKKASVAKKTTATKASTAKKTTTAKTSAAKKTAATKTSTAKKTTTAKTGTAQKATTTKTGTAKKATSTKTTTKASATKKQ